MLIDSEQRLGNTPVGQQLGQLLDRESTTKCERFLESACQNGGAFNWELNVRGKRSAHGMCFAALRGDDGRLLVVASGSPSTTLRLLDASLTLSAEAMNKTASRAPIPSWDALSEITRVNNALVGLQRRLVKRNVELLDLTEERNKLLGILAHDLRGPVAVIHGYCELLDMKEHSTLSLFQHECIEKIQHACDRLTELFDGTLENARATACQLSGARVMVDVVELVRDDVELHRSFASRKNIELSLVCLAPIPLARLNPAGMHQVVSNLLSNAIKYSPPNSEITVSITRAQGELQITVQDHGLGIPANELDKLFQPYQVTSVRPTAGESSTGLGLAIVRDVVEAHGGHVHVESAVDLGSTFSVWIPLGPSDERRSDVS